MSKYVILVGNLSEGFSVFGNFNSVEEANVYARGAFHEPTNFHQVLPFNDVNPKNSL